MTNKEKYPNAKVYSMLFSYGRRYYVSLREETINPIYLVDGKPNEECTHGWHQTQEQAETALNNFMNEPHEITLKEIKRQYEEAKKLIGRIVRYKEGSEAKVDRVILDLEGVRSSISCDEFFEKNGYVVKLCSGDAWKVPYAPDIKVFNEEVAVIAHDGQKYTAKSDGDCWKFGCARISKTLIKQSLNLMNDKNFGGNRQIEKITIGKCDFSRETLKALVELENN